MTTTQIDSDLASALDELASRIVDQGPARTADRCLSTDLAKALADAGLFKMLVPHALGGLELDPLSAAEVVEAASRIDGSVGWCVMIGAQSAWYASFLPPRTAERVVGTPLAKLAGALKPGGKAIPCGGGYKVSGRWSLASGCTYADHLYGTCLVETAAGGNGHGDQARKELRVVYLPATEATIVDSWFSFGLQATGSHDFVLRDVFVPAEWTISFPELPTARHDGPLYRDGYHNLVFTLQAAQALGVARSAVESFAGLASDKVRWATEGPLRDQPPVQAQVAHVEACLRSARAWLWEALNAAWDTIVAGSPPSIDQRVLVRLAITHAITTAGEAADILQRAAGSAAVYSAHPLQRQFQDLRTAVAHVQATPRILELTGAHLLGTDVSFPPALI